MRCSFWLSPCQSLQWRPKLIHFAEIKIGKKQQLTRFLGSLGGLVVAILLSGLSRCKWGTCPQPCPLPAHLTWSTPPLGMPSSLQLQAILPSASSVLGVAHHLLASRNEWRCRMKGRSLGVQDNAVHFLLLHPPQSNGCRASSSLVN